MVDVPMNGAESHAEGTSPWVGVRARTDGQAVIDTRQAGITVTAVRLCTKVDEDVGVAGDLNFEMDVEDTVAAGASPGAVLQAVITSRTGPSVQRKLRKSGSGAIKDVGFNIAAKVDADGGEFGWGTAVTDACQAPLLYQRLENWRA
ncbi:histidine permease [Colletotrichum scovillei]|uniref:Histidine permease n=1 Tax=Colletotrichum scovillei TaxID=1209932 RepID=A0A9P7RHM5_9PEZI|nr:histidine permease [Colletotrichum scovillei]KAG7077019.1 histidine permease [Colletotrichum scovillei]KAG7084161.1 histidine permease [Colletotrichum scovillei]